MLLVAISHLDDEANSESQHLIKQTRLGADEHGQVDEELLSQHGSGLIRSIGLVDEDAQLGGWQRCGDGDLVVWRQPHGHLLLSHQQVSHSLGQVLYPLTQHA